jgi:ketosteroid isomerase-like protein
MSLQNVEVIRSMFESFPAANKEQLRAGLPEAIAEFCDPEIEFVETPERVDARTYRGHAGAHEAWERWLENWEEYAFEVDRIEDHGEHVLVVIDERARGRSGASAGARLYAIFTMRGGKILRYREFYDEAAARAVLGGG